MNLRDFVATTIEEVMEGVFEAQQRTVRTGGVVNPAVFQGMSGELDKPVHAGQLGAPLVKEIEFDVAVSVTEGTEKAGRAGIVVWGIGVGGEGKSGSATESVSRIRFSVPVGFPRPK